MGGASGIPVSLMIPSYIARGAGSTRSVLFAGRLPFIKALVSIGKLGAVNMLRIDTQFDRLIKAPGFPIMGVTCGGVDNRWSGVVPGCRFLFSW